MSVARPDSERIVITGIGVVSSIGTGYDAFRTGLKTGVNGAGPITLMDASAYTTRIAAEVKGFNNEDWVDAKDARRIDRFLGFTAAATKLALEDAQFPDDPELRENTACVIGSGIGGLTLMNEQTEKLHKAGPGRVSPFLVPYMIPDMASGYVSIQHGLTGPNLCIVSACSTGAHSIGEAVHMIRRGDCVAAVAGGAEAPINPIALAGFCAARTMTTRNDDPEHASRPFDADRDGFLIGEGAGIVILETLENAKKRGAPIYAEVAGYGLTGDAYHITSPDPNGDGARRAMLMALKKAGLNPEQVQYANAHGTSTELNDKTETLAIKRAFGDHAYKMAISSTKSQIGHTLGAAGALEAIACVMAIQDGVVPPTINLDTPDPECDLDYVPNEAREMRVDAAISNSFGFGGHNAALLLTRV